MGDEERARIDRYLNGNPIAGILVLVGFVLIWVVIFVVLVVVFDVREYFPVAIGSAVVAGGTAVVAMCGWIAASMRMAIVKRRVLVTWLKRYRTNQTEDTFVEFFSDDGIPPMAARETYHWFQKWEGDPGFPVGPEDEISRFYGVESLDREDMVLELLFVCDCRAPTEDEHDDLVWSTETVGDLVRGLGKLVIEPVSASQEKG